MTGAGSSYGVGPVDLGGGVVVNCDWIGHSAWHPHRHDPSDVLSAFVTAYLLKALTDGNVEAVDSPIGPECP